MNVFSLFPEYDEITVKVAQRLDNDDAVFAFDSDLESSEELSPGDLFQNRDDDRLYKVASVGTNDENGNFIVQASADFKLSPEEFSEVMDKLSSLDAEKRHMIGDAVMAHTFKQVAPEYAHAIGKFEQMGKWYA